jgi:hypothetical protein
MTGVLDERDVVGESDAIGLSSQVEKAAYSA